MNHRFNRRKSGSLRLNRKACIEPNTTGLIRKIKFKMEITLHFTLGWSSDNLAGLSQSSNLVS
jgi:hypothetical protein